MNLFNEMIREFELPQSELLRLLSKAPIRYKVYRIPKRQEGKYRIIAQPAREIKILQRWAIHKLERFLPIHKSATAYVRGASIKQNAVAHSACSFILKLDFREFFPSIRPEDLRRCFHLQDIRVSDIDKYVLEHLFFWRTGGYLSLSIGAPSSPAISNMVLHEVDSKIDKLCASSGCIYTRYADDITISTNRPNTLGNIFDNVLNVISATSSPRLTINPEKTVFSSKKCRRIVTGLVLTNDNKISLGRERKRALRAGIFRFYQGDLSREETVRLAGHLAFALDVEPAFVHRMVARYGFDLVKTLLRQNKKDQEVRFTADGPTEF